MKNIKRLWLLGLILILLFPFTLRADFAGTGFEPVFKPLSPGPIGSVTPSTGNFTTLVATTSAGVTGVNITAGSGTGITVNNTGSINRQVYKVTTAFGAYTDSDTTKGIVIATLPAKMKIVGFYADTTTQYTGGSTNAATMVVGITAESAAEIPGLLFPPPLGGSAVQELGPQKPLC